MLLESVGPQWQGEGRAIEAVGMCEKRGVIGSFG